MVKVLVQEDYDAELAQLLAVELVIFVTVVGVLVAVVFLLLV